MIYYVTEMSKNIDLCELDRSLTFGQEYLELDSDLLLHIIFSTETDGLFGYYEGVDEDEYQIVINSTLTRDDIVETLFHELVHINQHSKGDFDQELRLWKGKKYDCLYLDLPWEVQAFHHQDIMMEEYRNKRKDSLWNRHLNTMIPVTSGNGPRWKKILKSLKKGEIGDLQRDEEALYCICNKRDIHYDQTL